MGKVFKITNFKVCKGEFLPLTIYCEDAVILHDLNCQL